MAKLVGGVKVKSLRIPVVIVVLCFHASTVHSQLLPSQARGASRSQIVMLSVDGGCAAGIIVGYDSKAVYVATAAHVADLSAKPLPTAAVKFEGLTNAPRTGRFWPQFEARDKGDLAVVVVDQDAALSRLVNELDFAMLPSVPIGPADSPVTSIGCFGGGEWSTGSSETLLAPDQGYLRFQSNVGEGQSGGGLFNEAWELIGMPLDVGPNAVYARPIKDILEDLRKWGIPVNLVPRPLENRVRGADEIARESGAIAKSRELASTALSIGSSAADLGLLLSVEAIKIKDTPEARNSIMRLLAQSRGLGGMLGPQAKGANALAFSPDAKMLAVGVPGAVSVWDVASRKQLQRLTLSGPAAESVAILPDGSIAAGTRGGDLVLWAPAGGAELFRVHVGLIVMSIAFDSDGSRVAAGDIEGKVVIVSMKNEAVLRLAGEQGPTAALWLDGNTLIAGGGQGQVVRWDLSNPDKPDQAFIGAGQPFESAYDAKITLFSGFTSGSDIPYINDTKTGNQYQNRDLGGGTVPIDKLALSADGSTLAGAGVGGTIVLWDTVTGQRSPHDLIGHPGKVEALVFAPGGSLLAAGGPGGVTLFDFGTESLVDNISANDRASVEEVPSMARAGISAAFSANDSFLAWPVGNVTRHVVVWDLSANKESARFEADGVFAFSQSGQELALQSFTSDVASIVEVPSGKLMRTEPGKLWHSRTRGGLGEANEQPWAVENGHGIGASIVRDGTLTLWDTERRLPIGTVVIPGAIEASYLIFDNAGRRLAIATSGGALSIVDVSIASWIKRACALAGRELDSSEWQRYIGKDRPQEPTCNFDR